MLPNVYKDVSKRAKKIPATRTKAMPQRVSSSQPRRGSTRVPKNKPTVPVRVTDTTSKALETSRGGVDQETVLEAFKETDTADASKALSPCEEVTLGGDNGGDSSGNNEPSVPPSVTTSKFYKFYFDDRTLYFVCIFLLPLHLIFFFCVSCCRNRSSFTSVTHPVDESVQLDSIWTNNWSTAAAAAAIDGPAAIFGPAAAIDGPEAATSSGPAAATSCRPAATVSRGPANDTVLPPTRVYICHPPSEFTRCISTSRHICSPAGKLGAVLDFRYKCSHSKSCR